MNSMTNNEGRLTAVVRSNNRRWTLIAIAAALVAITVMLFAASPWTAGAQDEATEPPAKPTGLTGTVAHNQVALSWDNPGDDAITGYQVLRRDNSIHEIGKFIVLVDDTGSAAPSYTDTTVTPEGRYTYRVKARNANGLSSQSGYFDTRVPQPPAVTVSFDEATHTVEEGRSTTIGVTLSADPKREVAIPIVAAGQDGASGADYSGVPSEVTFNAGETRRDITLTATDDAEDDDGESVLLRFGNDLPDRVSAGNVSETTVSITDNDEPEPVPAPTPEPVEQADEDATRATAVDLGDITNLDGAQFPKYELDGTADAVNYYRFTLTAPKQVTLGLRKQDFDADLSLEDEDGETLKRSQKDGTSNEAIYQLALEGTYFINVAAQEAGRNRYTLRYGVAEPTADEVAELRNQQDPGSSRDTARDLGDITAVAETTTVNQQVEKDTDDYDYYRFTLTEQKAVQITVTNQDADADLYIENSSGGSLGSSTNSGTEDEQKTVVLDAGTYYVIVEARSTGANDYTLGYQTSMPVEKTEDTSVQEPVRVPFALQTIDLITNTGQNDTGDRAVDSSDTGFASSFITGLNGTGYSFEGVQIRLGGFDTGDTVQVRIYDSAGSTAYPNIRKYTLTNPDTLPTSDDQVTEFTAPADATLDPDAVYWVTVERTGGSFTIARTNSDDEIGETDWTIGDSSRQRAGAQHWSSASNSDRHLMFTVRGEGNTVDPEQTILASNATNRQATGARLINNSNLRRATSFTTGDNSVGYTLGQIDVPLNGISTGDTVYLKIYNDTSGAPDTLKHTFTAPNPFPAGTTVKVTFTAPTDATLNANTTYWMAIERNTGALEVSNTTSNEERGLSDWSIGNTEIKSTANNWDTITSFSQALRFTVWGRVNDEDTTGPSLQADNSHVNPAGDQVILQFNEDIDEDTADLPPINAFTVKADGETVLLENMEVSDSRDDQIKLNLASEAKIYEGQTVTVSYADPSTDDDTAALQDTSGGDADSFTDEEIQNESALIENLLVTNTGETKHGDRAVDSSDQGFASSFTTGDEPNGYILQDVQIQMGSFDSGDAVIVQLYSDAGEDKPAYSEILLSNPGTLPSTDDQTAVFTAPAGTILSTSAKYWLTVERTSGSFTIARADGDDQTGQTGWEIGNNTRQRGTGTWSNASSSNKHLTFTIRGEANDQEDTTGPSLQADNSKVNANGNQVILRFHEDIDEDTADLPPISAFTVRADGQTLLLEDTDIASSRDDEIKLNLASGELIYRGQTVTVSYQDPTSGDDSAALQNPDGDDAESFTDEEIPNLSTQIQNALVHNITTEKVNDRTMTINGPGFASSFTTGDGPGGYVLNDVQIRMGGLTSGDDFNVRIYSDSSSGPDDIEYTLTNPTPLPSGGDVTVEFQAPADSLLEPGTKYWVAVDWVAGLFTTAITASDDQTGETGWSIDNNSRFWTTGGWSNSNTMNRVLMFAVRGEISGDTTGPALVGGRSFAVRHGEEVDLTFNEDIDQDTANLPPVGAFIIKADGRNLSLLDLNISADDRIIVNLGPGEQIYQGQTVTVSYTDPTSGDDSAAIQDTSGNDAESFTDMEIHNLSRQIEHLLVTNTGEADHGDRAVDSSDTGFASSFTTGDEPGGYVLMDVLIQMGGFDSADDVVVKLYSNSSNRPDDILYTLANPASLPSDDDQTVEFAAPTGSILDPETKYWVTVERVTGSFTIARADGDGQTGETGWEIGDTTRQKGAGSWNDASSSDKHLTFTVRGAVSTGGRALWSATLTVGTDTGTGCTGAIPGTVGTLSDDDFDHDSTEYDISRICIMNNQLVLGLDPSGASVFNSQDFTLQIGEETFNFADAPVDTNDRFIWYSPSLTWQDNAEVSLRIVHDDITGPTLVADTTVVDVSGEITYIRFDEPLDRATGAEPPISAFTLTANGRDIPLDSFYIPTSEPSLLALIHQRGQRVYAGETLRLNYQDPTSGDDEQALQDPSGNDVESFSNVEIDNLSEADSPGTISISSAQSTIREGDEGNPGPQTVTWTLWATTDYDLEPRAGFELEVSVRSFPGSAGSDIDYELYSETYFLRNTDFTRQRVPADSNTFRYTATITGTVTILDYQIVEEDEDMVIRAIPTLTAWPFTHDLTVTITDQDTFGLRLEANQEYALQGRNNDINLTWKVLTGDGQEADSCTVPFIFDAATAVGGTAGTSDYSHTVRTGSLEPSFSACENTESTTVRITTTDTARQDRTITFNPSVDHARFDSRLTERAVITLRDNAPPSVRNISIQRRDSALDLTWNSQAHATGYTVQWKSGSEEYSSSREADVAGGENRKYSITGLDNATEYTLRARARARDDRGNGPWSSERRGTPSNLHALVSNLNRSGTRNKDVGATSGTIRSWAQKFTTGPATAYHLENVVLRLKEVDSNDTPVVRIHAHGTVDETPRRARYTLITPDGLTVGSTAENITFKAPPDAFLVGNTTYWIVVTDTSSDHDLIGTNSNAEDAENGWSIGDESIRRNRSNPWDKNNDYNSSFRMAVNGSAADPTPQTVWEATLTVGEAADVPDGNLEREFGYREGNYRVDADGNTRGRHGIGSLTVHRIQNGWEYTVIESLLQFELGGVQIQGNRNSKAQYLAFATNMELPPGSTLVIGDQEYELNGKNSYDRYGIDDITWRAGDRINLAVRIPAFARLKPVTASFGNATHYAGERGQKAVVEVRLSEAPERTLTIPLTYTNEGGARDADHQGIPESVTFGPEDTTQTFEVTAVADESWKENKRERVSISLGQMPTGVRVGNQDTTDVFLIDAVLEVWMEFPEDPWVTEGDGKIKVDFVARSREHNRTTGQFSAAAVLFAADGTNNTSAQITGHFAAATQNDDYTRFSEAVRYNEPRWEWDPQCNCSTFRKPYEISIINDDAAEPVEEVAIRIILGGRPDSYTSRDTLEQSNIDRYNFFIIDDDSDKPVISLEAVRDSVTEGTAIGITLNTDKLTTRNVPVKLNVSEDGNTLTADGTLDFTIPLGVTEHTVYLSTVNDDVRENASTVKVEVHTNKNDDGQQYHVGPPRTVRVQVQDNEVESSPPGTPQRVSAIAGNRTVTLSWDAPLELGDARLRRYEVQDITAGAGPWTNVGTRTSHTFRNLTNGTFLVFRVRAVSDSGNGTPSYPAAATPTSQTNPEAPQGLAADGYDGRVFLSWAQPVHNGGSAIRRYEYRYAESRETAQPAYNSWRSTGSAETNHTVRGLTNGQPYNFQVRAVNSSGRESHAATVSNVAPRQSVEPLTVAVDDPPANHGGGKFTVTLRFSHLLATSLDTIKAGRPANTSLNVFDYNDRTPFIQVTGGRIAYITKELEKVQITGDLSDEEIQARWNNQDDLYHITIMPASHEPVTLSMQGGSVGRTCHHYAHICNSYEDHLSNSIEHIIAGPKQLTVSDASAREGTDSTMSFTVRLSGPAAAEVKVRWQTQDLTAMSTTDYEGDSGTVTFAPGETTKTVTIGIRDDSSAEGAEDFRLLLTSATGAVISDGIGVGRINDNE